ncbi:hypothetical protein FOA43_003880 [Brettanomyces nanus]|uniref:non-specific serine/threonine protein kinase n=1 Tax=Eeniella nana TaxID=13502 RepID=A0A875S4B7_EENNA|nr:uncharacterized protein FOA43_003880 [Brettanomyces nanus]QPG76491.1 hypothetical protein FOA43_003880 [Brettanomyces nanus]
MSYTSPNHDEISDLYEEYMKNIDALGVADSSTDYVIANGNADEDLNSYESQESLPSSSPGSPIISASPYCLPARTTSARQWEERGAAKIVTRETDSEGHVVTKVLRKSAKDFEMSTELGEGSYSTVVLGKDISSGTVYAIKILDKRHIIKEKKVKYVNIEKNALNRLNKGRGIAHLYYTFQDERSLYFVLEYAPHGELLALIKKYGSLTMDTAHYYSAQLIDAIDYMHSHGVVHRDIKPENVLIGEDYHILVTDFGTAKLLDRSEEDGTFPSEVKASSFVGTAEYVSPELLNDKFCGMPADIWAFGCIVYQMIAGKPPFKAGNEYQTFQKVIKVQYAFSAGFPAVIRDLVKQILVKKPSDRLTVEEVKNHYWFRDVNWKEGSVWNTGPPSPLGPYKFNAKVMMPVPELGKPKRGGPRIISMGTSPQPSRQRSKAVSQSQPQSHSQRHVSVGNGMTEMPHARPQSAPLAAQVALAGATKVSITPTINSAPSTPSIQSIPSAKHRSASSPGFTDLIPGTNIPRPILNTRVSRSKSSPRTFGSAKFSTNGELPPMSSLDLNWVEFFRHPDERIIKAGIVDVSKYSTADFEKKYKGMLAESPLGYRSQDLLENTQINSSADAIKFSNEQEVDEKAAEEAKDTDHHQSRFRSFFSYKGSSVNEPSFDSRVLLTTTMGRALLFIQNHDRKEHKYQKSAEIDLTDPNVHFVEVIGDRRPKTGLSTLRTGTFAIVSSSVTLVFEVERQEVGIWTASLANARITRRERILRDILAMDPPAGAGTNTGGEAAFMAASVAASKSPTLRPSHKKGRKPPPPFPHMAFSDGDIHGKQILSNNTPMISAAVSKAISSSSSSTFYLIPTATSSTAITSTRPITSSNSRMLSRSRNK